MVQIELKLEKNLKENDDDYNGRSDRAILPFSELSLLVTTIEQVCKRDSIVELEVDTDGTLKIRFDSEDQRKYVPRLRCTICHDPLEKYELKSEHPEFCNQCFQKEKQQ